MQERGSIISYNNTFYYAIVVSYYHKTEFT